MTGTFFATGTPAAVATPAVNPNAPVPNIMANDAERPEKFSGLNFKRWQQKTLFYLTALNLARFLTETGPIIVKGRLMLNLSI